MMNEKQRVAKIVGILFASRDYAHRAHLKTSSYSDHKALKKFYEEVVEVADTISEVGQGKFGLLTIPKISFKSSIDDPARGLQTQLNSVLAEAEGCGTGALRAVVDEIEMLFLQTIYKLKHLN